MGMDGAGAINRVHAEGLAVEVAACDQSNAFTEVLCPKWFYPYQAVPPVVAAEVWDLLPMAVQFRVAKHDLVSPVYMRLPMGSSHSVHILMSINLQIIGRTLYSFLQRGATPGADMPAEECKEAGRIDCDEDETNAYDMSDEDWWSVFSKGANLGRKDAARVDATPDRFEDFRTIAIMIFFAGERRQDDIQSQVERMAKVRNISVSVISVDLATDDRWDLASKETFHVSLQVMKGFVDIVSLCYGVQGAVQQTMSRSEACSLQMCVSGRKDPRKRESGKQMGFGYITWRYASPYLDKEELICGNTPKTQRKTRFHLYLQQRSFTDSRKGPKQHVSLFRNACWARL